MNMKSLKYLAAGAVLASGCVSGDLSSSRRIHPDDETMDGGISSADIRTVASKMCPAILSVPEVADGQPPVRIKIANVKNSTRFFIDGDLFAKRLHEIKRGIARLGTAREIDYVYDSRRDGEKYGCEYHALPLPEDDRHARFRT